jgi:hypothetical protein
VSLNLNHLKENLIIYPKAHFKRILSFENMDWFWKEFDVFFIEK